MNIVTAGMNGVPYLYNYQRFCADRLERILSTNSIHLSDTKNFNDPWDCRPYFDLEKLDDPAFRERQIQFLANSDKTISAAERESRVTKLRNDRAFLEHCIGQVSSGIGDQIQQRYRVYCLTTKPANTLMWAHYANNHAGVCLEFRCDHAVLSGALQVVYCDKYPALDLADTNQDTTLLPLLVKAQAWAYEDEYRIVAQEEAAALNTESLITRKNFLQLPDNALAAIVVGCVSDRATRDGVAEIIKRSGRSIEMKEARRVPNHYSLKIETM
jgi:Protein of unknown function (DUF2971)